jgi:putative ABC transport system permease protein
MSKRRWLIELGLLAYPSDFRQEYRAQILADLDEAPTASWRAAVDIAAAGIRMRIDDMGRDASFGIRRLRKAPLFVAIVVGAFALGIGANVAVFSVLNAVLLKPLPYPNSARLVVIAQRYQGVTSNALSLPDVSDLRSNTTQFAAIGAESEDSATLTGIGRPHAIDGLDTSWNFFNVIGMRPVLGRFFNVGDGGPGRKSIVVSDRLWRSRLGGGADIIGKAIDLDGVPYRVVGVAPNVAMPAAERSSLGRADFWTPLPNTVPPSQRGARYVGALGLLRPTATLATANAQLALASVRLAARYPNADAGVGFIAQPISSTFFGSIAVALWTVFAAVIGILLITCANIASVVLTNASTRKREFAVRSSLGASGRRLGAQVFVETAMLAIGGGIIGTLLAYLAVRFLAVSVLSGLPRIETVQLDGAVLLYALAVVILATMFSGMWQLPMLERERLAVALNSAGRSGDLSSGGRIRSTLVIFEVAVALALVVLSGLMLRSFYALTHVDLGIRPAGIVVTDLIGLPSSRYASPAARVAFDDALLARLRSLPGVREVALSVSYPLSDTTVKFSVPVVGKAYAPGQEPDAHFNAVTPAYFDTLGIPLVAGRTFRPDDSIASQQVTIVNATFVKKYLSYRNPIGARLRTAGWNGSGRAIRTIVGVVGDERQRLARPAPPMYYTPAAQQGANILSAVARVDVLRSGVVGKGLQDAVAATDPLLDPPATHTMEELIATGSSNMRSTVVLLGALSAIALLLALSGVFGVVSYSVTQRYREFGIRRALGATTREVLLDVFRRALLVGCLGAVIGSFVAVVGARAIASQLYGVSPLDAPTFAIVILLLLGCGGLAALIPAVRATRVDPRVALHYE